MTDPKTFTGPEGWCFEIRDTGPHPVTGPCVRITSIHNYDFITVPLAELRAFVAASPAFAYWPAPADDRHARAEARRQAYAGSTAERSTDTEGRDFPPGTRVVTVEPAADAPNPFDLCAGMARANAAHLIARDGWCRKCGWDSADRRCPAEHPSDCDGVT